MSVDPRARGVLREYRRATARTKEQRADVWARIEHSIDADARVELEEEPAARQPRRVAALLVVVLGSTAAALGVGLIPRLGSSPTPQATTPPPIEAPAPAEPPRRPRPTNPSVSQAPLVDPPAPAVTQPQRKKEKPPAVDDARAAEALREEMALIASARSSLRDARPEDALRTLERHLRRFPEGQMREDRAALRIEALCRVGKHRQASIELERFATQHPSSAHLERLRATCSSRE